MNCLGVIFRKLVLSWGFLLTSSHAFPSVIALRSRAERRTATVASFDEATRGSMSRGEDCISDERCRPEFYQAYWYCSGRKLGRMRRVVRLWRGRVREPVCNRRVSIRNLSLEIVRDSPYSGKLGAGPVYFWGRDFGCYTTSPDDVRPGWPQDVCQLKKNTVGCFYAKLTPVIPLSAQS